MPDVVARLRGCAVVQLPGAAHSFSRDGSTGNGWCFFLFPFITLPMQTTRARKIRIREKPKPIPYWLAAAPIAAFASREPMPEAVNKNPRTLPVCAG